MDIETVLNNEFSEELYLNQDFPSIVEINSNEIDLLDENGNKLVEYNSNDIIENEYNTIITRYYLDEYGMKYIKYEANFTEMNGNYLYYDIKILLIRK